VVQLRWVYAQHESNTATGSRAHLALDDIIISTEPLMSLDDFDFANSLNMYPNPTSDLVHFNREISLQIFDITGKMVFSADNTKTINIQGLSKGIYILKTTEGISKKLIVK
jgi:hypothetical protein